MWKPANNMEKENAQIAAEQNPGGGSRRMAPQSDEHPLRILLIVPSLNRETGGPTISVPALGKALAKLGHKVVLYTTTWPLYGPDEVAVQLSEDSGYETLTFPAEKSLFFSNLPYSPALVQAVLKNSNHFDIVHSFSLWNPVATFSLRTLRRCGTSYCLSPLGMLDPIVLRRNRWKKLPWSALWERANIEAASLVHFTAALEEERARGYWRLKKTIIAPQIVDIEKWKTLPDRSLMEARFPRLRGKEVILFVGRINWVKNLDLLLSALAVVRRQRPGSVLVCAGPDNEGYQSVLEKQAKSLGIAEQVVFTGMLQGEDLKSAYARADALALVSQKENFGHAAAEALACGIPVVLSSGVGVAADWAASDAVRRVAPEPAQIASALIEVLKRSAAVGLPDPEARSLAERYLGEFPAAKIAAAYQSLLSHKGEASNQKGPHRDRVSDFDHHDGELEPERAGDPATDPRALQSFSGNHNLSYREWTAAASPRRIASDW
jgi:glycosyltransferase involved in cell wall biosynthesis